MYENKRDTSSDGVGWIIFWVTVVILGVIVGLITLFSSMRFVGTGEIGVVSSYGKVTGRELSEGMAWVAPWGANNVNKYSIQVQKEETPDVAAATKDLQDAKATVVLNYQLEAGKVSEIHQTIGSKYSEKLIAPAVQEVFKANTSKYTASETITNRPALKADVVQGLTERLKKYGIRVLDVSLTNFAFSAAFNQSIEQTQVAQQEVIKARNELEKTKVEAEKAIAEAYGKAESQRIQQESLTPEILQRDAIWKWDGKMPTTITGDASTIFSIPIK